MSPLSRLAARIDPRNSWIGYLAAAGMALGLGLALLDPSASRGAGLAGRIVFWLAHVGLALVLLEMAQFGVGRLRATGGLPPLVQIILSGLLGAAIFAPFALVQEALLVLPGIEVAADDLTLSALIDEVRVSGGTVLLFWVLLNMPRLLIIAQQGDAEAAAPAAASVPQLPPQANRPEPALDPQLVELLARLPPRVGRDIVAVTAELHYLRVHTAAGDALILMSFGRAVEALSAIHGQRIHRSHWVALAHVAGVETRGETVICRLDTGLTLPVSRSWRAPLRAALADRQKALAEIAARRLTRSGAMPG